MQLMTRRPWTRVLSGCLVIIAILVSSCATKQQVNAIVAESNALMVTADLAYPASSGGEDWKNAVRRIDLLIDQNADQTALVATLRARQALLLTAFKQDALAREAWKQVDWTQLKTDRDRAFYLLRDDLIWWFKFGPSDGTIGNDDWSARLGPPDGETPKPPAPLSDLAFNGDSTVQRFELVCNALPVGSDTRLYLEVMRANIVVRALNDAQVQDPNDREALATYAVRSVKRLTLAFDNNGQQWLKSNYASADLPKEAELMSMLRSLSQARAVIKETRRQASEQELVIPRWQPDWVNDFLKPVPAGHSG